MLFALFLAFTAAVHTSVKNVSCRFSGFSFGLLIGMCFTASWIYAVGDIVSTRSDVIRYDFAGNNPFSMIEEIHPISFL